MKSPRYTNILLLGALSLQSTTSFSKKLAHPNVIMLFADQHNAGVFGYTGHPDVITPNLDKMADQGVVFNRAYCQDGICAPSRSSIMTGLYPRTLGFLTNGKVNTTIIQKSFPLALAFQQNGYDTYSFGKRHLEDRIGEGWTEIKSDIASESPKDNYAKWIEKEGYAEEFGEDWASAGTGRFPAGNSMEGKIFPISPMATKASRVPQNKTMEAYAAGNTIKVINEHAKTRKPFFCFTSFHRPHQPYTYQPKYFAMYDVSKWGEGTKVNGGVREPASLRQSSKELPPMLANLREKKNGVWCLGLAKENEQLYRNYIGSYYALVTDIDYWVGEIINELEKNGMLENTIILYTSDHGDFVGGHGMIEKAAVGHNVYEETLRVPLMFYWKNHILKGIQNYDLIESLDIYPSLIELAGIRLPKLEIPLQGISLAPTLLQNRSVKRDFVVSENWSQATVITKDMKLGIWLDPQGGGPDYRNFGNMLFDYKTDKYELKNLYNSPDYTESQIKLMKYFKTFEETISSVGKEEVVKNMFVKNGKRVNQN